MLIFFSSIKAQIRKQIHPNAVVSIKINSQTIDRDLVYGVILYIALYVTIVFIVTVLLTLMGIDMTDSFTSSVASMGNVGPGFGNVGSLGNYSDFPMVGKFILTIQMLLGRLEIYSLLLIFVLYRWR